MHIFVEVREGHSGGKCTLLDSKLEGIRTFVVADWK